MTVGTAARAANYTGNGVTTSFPVPFQFLELAVYANAVRVSGSEYTISQAAPGLTGSVVFNVAPPTGTKVRILGDTVVSQQTDYVENHAFPAESHERGLDRLTMALQEFKRDLGSFGSDWSTHPNKIVSVDANGAFVPLDKDKAGYIWIAEDGTVLVTEPSVSTPVTLASVTQAVRSMMLRIGDPVISMAPTPAPGRIRLGETPTTFNDTDWPELAAWLTALGKPWGGTSTTSTLPRAAGYALRFAATSSTIDPDGPRAAGSFQGDLVKAHDHEVVVTTSADGAHSHTYDKTTFSGGASFSSGGGTSPVSTSTATSTAPAHTHTVVVDVLPTGGAENRGKNVAYHLDVVASSALSGATLGSFGFAYAWSTSTVATDPGAGVVRGNHASLASITSLYVSKTDAWGVDLSGLLTALGLGSRVRLSKIGAQANTAVVSVSGAVVDGTGFVTIPVSVVASGGSLLASDSVSLEPLSGERGEKGDRGDPGMAIPSVPLFTPETDAPLASTRTSAAVAVAGDATTVWPVAVRGHSSAELVVNDVPAGKSANVRAGDSLKLRLLSSSALATIESAILYAQGVTRQWDVTTTNAALPAGALGAWYAKDYDATRRAVPNALSATPLSENLLRAPRRLFGVGNSAVWSCSGCVVTNDNATAHDGSTQATTIVGTGNWFFRINSTQTLPAGTYTMAGYYRSGTGTDQLFRMAGVYTIPGTISANKTATTTLQRFTHTFTAAAAFPANNCLFGWSIDEATGATLEVHDCCLYAGATAPAEAVLSGHMYLGTHTGDTGTPANTSYVDLSTGGLGVVQFPTTYTGSAYTVVAIAAKTVTGAGLLPLISKAQDYNALTAWFEETNKPGFHFGGQSLNNQASGLWDASNRGYYAYSARQSGTESTVWINDAKLIRKAYSPSAISVRDYWVGIALDRTYPAKHRLAAMAIWPRALTDAEMRQAVNYLKVQASAGGITTEAERIYVAEGDSITEATSPVSYAYRVGTNLNPWGFGGVYAVSGAGVADLEARASTIDAILPPPDIRGSKKYILSVLCTNGITASDYLSRLQAYCQARTAAGWTVVALTLPPRSGGAHNTARNAHNTTIRTWPGLGYVAAVSDIASDATVGTDAAGSNTTHYPDGVHPSAGTHTIFETYLRATINAI